MSLYPNFNDLIALKKRKWKGKKNFRPVKNSTSGHHVSLFRAQGLEFDAVRQYVIGDDIRAIDWRVTARTGAPHIKLFHEEREHHHIICIDLNETMRFGTKKTFKSIQAAEVAALLGWRGVHARDRVSAFLYGDVLGGIQTFPSGPLYPWIKVLTQEPLEKHSVNLNKVIERLNLTHSGSIIYIISDFIDLQPDVEVLLHLLTKKCSLVFIAVNDPMDQSLYPMGTIGFTDLHKTFFIDTNRENEVYMGAWKSNRKLLYSLCSRLKIPLIELTTESDPFRVLYERFSKC